MIVYATHAGGRYLPMEESLREQPEGKRAVYVNITNDCNCDCVFCLRSMKEMARESSLWIEHGTFRIALGQGTSSGYADAR